MIIGLSGKIKSGKNEFYNHLHSLLKKDGLDAICEDFSFGLAIKKTAALIFNIEYSPIHDREFKEDIFVDLSTFKAYTRDELEGAFANFDYVYDNEYIDEFIEAWEEKGLREYINEDVVKPNRKPRILITMRIWLQYFGTNVCREFIKDFWINSTMQSLNLDNNFICTDVRFPNEAQAILDKGGIVIRIEREVCNNRENEHSSETSLDNFDGFTYIIDNNGSLEEFHNKIETLYTSIYKDLLM